MRNRRLPDEFVDKTMRLLKALWPSKIRYQLILGVAALQLTLMSLFVLYLVERQRDFLLTQSFEQTKSLVNILAINSSSWVLANDVVGLGELINSVQRYPELRYAMVIDRDGKVMAHTDRSKVGLYVKDRRSLSLLGAKPEVIALYADDTLLDVAAPIFNSTGESVGWARIGHGQEHITGSLSIVSRNGVLYALVAISVGSVFAALIGYRLTSGLNSLLSVSGQIRNGRRDLRMDISHGDEISGLGRGLNQMLDSMVAVEDEIRDLYNNAPCGYHSLDKDGIFVRINDTELSWLGYSRGEIIGKKNFSDIVTPASLKVFQENYPGFKERGWVKDLEFEMISRGGAVMTVLLSSTAIRDSDGAFIMSRSTIYDITEWKETEQALKQLSQRNEMILNSAGEGIYGTDVHGNILFVNPAAAEILGFEIEELTGKNSHRLFHHTKEDGRAYPLEECPLYKSLSEGEVHRGQEEVFWGKGGRKIYVEHVNTPLVESGRIVGAVVVFRDMTGRKRMEEDLRRINEGLDLRVKERTSELERKIAEIEHLNKLFVGRELRMMELKEKIKELETG